MEFVYAFKKKLFNVLINEEIILFEKSKSQLNTMFY